MDNGALVWGLACLPALVLDAVLVRSGRTSLTLHVRHHPAVAGALGACMIAHFAGHPLWARRFDPLSAAARRLSR